MSHVVLPLAAGFFGGVVLGWLGRESTSTEPFTAESSSMRGIEERCAEIESRLDDVLAELRRPQSHPVPANPVERSDVRVADERPDFPPELDRLRVEMERLIAIAKSTSAPSRTVEDLVRQKASPPNWTELAKVSSEKVCESLVFCSADDILRCFGPPTRTSGEGGNGVWWFYRRDDPKFDLGIQLVEGRVVRTSLNGKF